MVRMVRIEHKDGREYAIDPKDFDRVKIEGDKTYSELGFKITRYDDNLEPYKEPRRVEVKKD